MQDFARKFNFESAFYLVLLHIGAAIAPFYFTWSGFGVFVGLWIATGIGVTMGYHRLLTHNSFTTFRPVRWFFALLGGLAGQGGAVQWVADHRCHHENSDHAGDPHSPTSSFLWGHLWWNVWHVEHLAAYHRRYAPDLIRDRLLVFISELFLVWNIAASLLLFYFGGLNWVLWGTCFRIVFGLHVTWAVNSICHTYGYTNYVTSDRSKNNHVVGWLSFGEGYHNNHHAYPSVAHHGHNSNEFDLTYLLIRILKKLGLAWRVITKN